MRFSPSPPWMIFSVTSTIGFLAGCASAQKPNAVPGEPKQIVEYDTVYRTGSNLPVRVPKSPTARPLPGANEVSTMSPEAFRDLVSRGQAAGRR
jgi:hypothetical protein